MAPVQSSLFQKVIEPIDTGWRPKPPPDLSECWDIALDVETDGLDWSRGNRPLGIAIRVTDGRSWYLPWGHRGGNLDEAVVKDWAKSQLREKHIINLNTRFDLHMMREWGVDLEAQGCTATDVGHQAALLDDNRRRFNLEELAQTYLGYGKLSSGIDATKMKEYHASQIAKYAEMDVRLAMELNDMFMPWIQEQDLERVLDVENRLIWAVCEMERNAAPLDMEKLTRWVKEVEQAKLRLLWEINRESGLLFDPSKPSSWAKLFEHYGLEIPGRTETGKPSFTDEGVARTNHPVVQIARKAKKLDSLQNKYITPYYEAAKGDGRLRYQLHQMRADEGGTVTGRFSSSNVNIQQVKTPEKQMSETGDQFLIRELFIPESGQWLSADAMQIEYRLFAHYAAPPKVLAAYESDPLTSFHFVVWEMVKQFKPDLQYKPLKNYNFAKLYGAGVRKQAEMLGIPLAEAKALNAAYDQAFPEAKQVLARAATAAEQRGYVKTILGRRSRFSGKMFLHKAFNRIDQGGAADIMKMKIVELHEQRKDTGFKLRFTVHDEVCGDVPDLEAALKVQKILNHQSFPELKVPILWDVKTGANWKEC